MTAQAKINHDVLHWARERARLTVDQLAHSAHVKPEQVSAWEEEGTFPTFRQAQALASATRIPFGFLFLPKPPEEKLPLPDLRTVGGQPVGRPSVDLLDTVRNVLQKQAWYADYLKDQGHDPLRFVGAYKADAATNTVVEDMRRVLNLGKGDRRGNWEEYHRTLMDAADAAGILVMRSGMVGNNTHRKLDVAEFRGFAVADPLAPLVFINSSDAPAARLFTFVHELAHLWIGSSGISSVAGTASRREERFCNTVAGEFLVPENEFRAIWNTTVDWRENVSRLTGVFHVSNLVIARRARDLGMIDDQTHNDFYLAELAAFRNKKSSGGGWFSTQKAKNGMQFSMAVIREAHSGRLLIRDAGRLLGVQPAKIGTYAEGFAA
jgi:Zn-dependent peptidase ImmA (M78 family)/transcriptional regulator with XRE-family HTH domain